MKCTCSSILGTFVQKRAMHFESWEDFNDSVRLKKGVGHIVEYSFLTKMYSILSNKYPLPNQKKPILSNTTFHWLKLVRIILKRGIVSTPRTFDT